MSQNEFSSYGSSIPLQSFSGGPKEEKDDFNWDQDSVSQLSFETKKPTVCTRFVASFKKLPLWVRTLVLIVFGDLLFMVPALVDYGITVSDNPAMRGVYFTSFISSRMAIQGLVPTFVFFIFVMISWTVWFGLEAVVTILPDIIIRVLNGFFGQVTKVAAKYVNYIRQLRGYISFSLWSLISFTVWKGTVRFQLLNQQHLFTNNAPYVPAPWDFPTVISKFLRSCLVVGLIVFGEKLILQIFTVSFNRKTYNDRIEKYKNFVFVLERLNVARRVHKGSDFGDGSYDDFDDTISDVSLTPSARERKGFLSKVQSHAHRAIDVTTSAVKDLALEVKDGVKTVLLGGPGASVVLLSLHDAKKLAKQLFHALLYDSPRSELDFAPYFTNLAEAEKAFSLFDRDGNGDISKSEFKYAICEHYKEHRSLEKSMRDSGQALEKLDTLLMAFVYFIALLVVLNIFSVDISAITTSLAAIWVGALFAVGPTIKSLLDSVLFLFAVHPFDVGDAVIIDLERYTVMEFGLMTTVLKHASGKEIYAPNSVLATKFIHNIRRSGPMSEVIKLPVMLGTSQESIEKLEILMLSWLKQNHRDYNPTISITVGDIVDKQSMLLNIPIDYKSNWQDVAKYSKRRNAFLQRLRETIDQVGIQLADNSSMTIELTSNRSDLGSVLGGLQVSTGNATTYTNTNGGADLLSSNDLNHNDLRRRG